MEYLLQCVLIEEKLRGFSLLIQSFFFSYFTSRCELLRNTKYTTICKQSQEYYQQTNSQWGN